MGKLFLILAALAALAQAPARGVADPRAFIAERYALYARGEGAIPELDAIVSSRLRAHLDAHDEAQGGEELIDRDWWVNGRAGEAPRLGRVAIVEEPDRDPARRIVAARFRNHGRPALIRFHFRHEQAAWRLDEVVGEAGGRRWTLTGLLAARP